MSETSVQLQTQATFIDTSVSLNSSGRPVIAHDTSQARRQVRHKPKFAEFVCSEGEVYRYANLVTKAVVPQAMWGNVKHMITARRYETLSLHQVLQDFQTSDCEWLMPAGGGARAQTRVSVSDALKRRELLEEFLFWYFDSFLIPLLKTTFYVTESSAFRNRVIYFRHDDWSTLCAPLVEKLSTDTFQRIEQCEAHEILRQRRLGFSFVRLLPKETGVRPIVNLRRRVDKDAYRPGQSINQILQAAFQILTYEKDRQPDRLGASVFGPNEIYAKLKAFKCRLTGNDPSKKLPKLYFVKVDVQACFDTIEQTKLLDILRELLTEDAYMIQRYGTVNKAGEKMQRKYVKKALPEDDHPHFMTYAAKLAEVLRNTIFADQVVYPFSRRKEIIALLEEHITENIVKIGNEYYRQVVGIPQGSVLSAILCSFFYGDLERKNFRFTDDDECVLMRLIDDWLLITADRSKATRFYDIVSKGHPEYGCFISKDKSLLNFDHPELVTIVDPRSKVFPWCGYSINMQDLSVTVDYTRYHTTYLQDSLTVEFGRRPGAVFAHKMMQLAKSKSHIVYNDATLNSAHAVHLNAYQNFTVLAMKMHHYLRQWGLDVPKHHAFVLKTIRQAIRFAYTSACNKATHKLARTHAARIDLQERQAAWLGLHAFHTVFSRKPQAYARLLKALSFELSLPRYRCLRKRFRGVVAEGLSTLTLLCF
ncbi:Telomerase reverse transcriptase [Trametes pubescens]|uniref:Telomerase reverse transcriptase n=1 Tax=Trametes pubescens TaxID=154538 RepID=A0A1M2VIG7_TRAPU|nr:Telomerase reverse transcriptase [Trametes pubescens]